MGLGKILFSFDGRINRAKFWLGLILGGVIGGLLIGVAMGLVPWDQVITLDANGEPVLDADGNPNMNLSAIGPLPIALFFGGILLSLWMSFAVMVKRCHDRGFSGWMSLIYLIPLAGPIWALIALGIMEGEKGPNAWGPNPLGNQA